jgi:hypothetical protein
MADHDPALVEAARTLIADDERAKKETARKAVNERIDQLVEMAMTRMDNKPEMAANLFLRWAEQDDSVRALLQTLIREAIELRISKIPIDRST